MQAPDIDYIKMDPLQFAALSWLLPWSEHARIARLRDHWRSTWLDIQNVRCYTDTPL